MGSVYDLLLSLFWLLPLRVCELAFFLLETRARRSSLPFPKLLWCQLSTYRPGATVPFNFRSAGE